MSLVRRRKLNSAGLRRFQRFPSFSPMLPRASFHTPPFSPALFFTLPALPFILPSTPFLPPPHRYSINFSFGGTWRALLEISEVPYTLRCETTKIIFHNLFLQEKTKVVTPLEAIRVTFTDGGKSPSLTSTFNLKLKK